MVPDMRSTAYIGVGSNLGDKLANCLRAIELVGRMEACQVIATSPFYRTAPVGVRGQDWYVNGVFSVMTGLSPAELLKGLLEVEALMGRERKEKWGPRTIDLDILLFGEHVIESAGLTIPHPLMHTRRFVLEPISRLAPDLMHPVLKMTMTQILNSGDIQGQDVALLGESQ
jgi:2-amino-4-hydroxy-6-hydroxymethyldihydropteridine diphosphokinase